MATQTEKTVVYAAGVVQGIALVTFPAASTILTDPAEYDLSSTQYGTLFLPQVITAITAALLGARLGGRFGTKRVYLVGLAASLVSMALLLVSSFLTDDQELAYGLLLLATASLGAGFGFTVPAINTLTAAFNPTAVSRSILVLNALLGLGTVLTPVFVAIFDGLGFWWGLPLLSGALLVVLIVVSLGLPLQTGVRAAAAASGRLVIPRRFWVYAGFAVLYGICETVNGNWAQLDMTSELGASTTSAAFALTAFWAMVTVGRVVFAAVQRIVSARLTYHVLPFVLAGSSRSFRRTNQLSAFSPSASRASGARRSCRSRSASARKNSLLFSAAAAGGVIAFYQLGYGIAAFGVGPLLDNGVELPRIYAFAAVVAAAMGLWSFVVATRRPSPETLHPQPG